MKKKLAIVSSYNTACGNASYTHVLKKGLEKYYDVTIIAVDYQLLGNRHPDMKEAAEKYISEIEKELSQFDYVNIQFEVVLYGTTISSINKNISRLMEACKKNLTVTIHHLHTPQYVRPFPIRLIKSNFNLIKAVRESGYQRFNSAIFDHFFSTVRRLSSTRNIKIIVHTPRDRKTVEHFYKYPHVADFPITFLDKKTRDERITNREAIREQFYERYNLEKGNVYIGIFGFLSHNKGHHIAVRMMNHLPSHYKLLIAGGQHPQSIVRYDFTAMMDHPEEFTRNSDKYVSTLTDMAIESGIDRVRFMGSLNDEDFLDAIQSVDFTVLPYFESGQNGSGNAALMLELEAKSIFSRCHAFMELNRYYPDCYEFADIGNSAEMAQKIVYWNKDFTGNLRKAMESYNMENNILFHKRLLEGE